jgi:hypothetical protein
LFQKLAFLAIQQGDRRLDYGERLSATGRIGREGVGVLGSSSNLSATSDIASAVIVSGCGMAMGWHLIDGENMRL